MRTILPLFGLGAVALFFAGCADLNLPQLPPATPPTAATPLPNTAPATTSLTYKKQNGKDVVIAILIPPANAAAQRYPNVYQASYAQGYVSEWNKKIQERQFLYRAYDGKFKSPIAETNFRLYDGESFALAQLPGNAANNVNDTYVASEDIYRAGDKLTASSTGRADGQHVARNDFFTQLQQLEK
jgi:hypothetical protein